ncbi:unnamed protein product [Caenorhabditis brenneri]
MTPVTFPLLKLPLLTIKHVFLVMTMEQIYDFSYCSKKAQGTLKSCNGKNVEISVYFSGDCKINFHRKNQWTENFSLYLKNIIPGCSKSEHFFESSNGRNIQLNSSPEPLEAAMSIIDHLFNTFDMEVSEFFIDGDCVQHHFRSMVQSFFQRQNVLNNVLSFGLIDREDLKYFIENSTVRNGFGASYLTIENPYNLNLNIKELSIEYAEWLTVSNLLTTSFETGIIVALEWTLNDFITFLNAWKDGWNPKLSHLKISSYNFYFQDFAENLPFGTIREDTVVRNCQYELGTPKTHQIKGGVDIRSNDGKLATVFGSGVRSCATEIHVWDE